MAVGGGIIDVGLDAEIGAVQCALQFLFFYAGRKRWSILSMNPVEFDPISRHFKGKNNGAGNYLTLTSVATIVAAIKLWVGSVVQ